MKQVTIYAIVDGHGTIHNTTRNLETASKMVVQVMYETKGLFGHIIIKEVKVTAQQYENFAADNLYYLFN